MKILIFSSSSLVFIIVVALLSGIGKDIDRRNRRLNSLERKELENIDDGLETPFFERFFAPFLAKLLKSFSKLFPKLKGTEATKLERDLKMAGIYLSSREFMAARSIFMLAFIAFIIVITLASPYDMGIKFLIFIFGVIIAFMAPRVFIQQKVKSRQEAIRQQMPDVMDLLSVSVEAGLGFDSALLKIEERAQGPMVDELILVHMEISMGRPRREAFKNLGDRSNVAEIKTFTGALIQAEQLGLPIKNILKSQARQLRNTRKQKAEEKAMKAPIKIMLPLVIFIFPVIFIILLGPTVIELMETFGK